MQFESPAPALPNDDFAMQEEINYVAATRSTTQQKLPGVPQSAELSYALKQNLKNLKNFLKRPQARTFVFCEFFYSAVDRQLFLDENEFSQLISDSFPNLKTTRMRLAEWREIRRLIGKPRRLSQAFLDEERRALESKRRKIRQIYSGQCLSLPQDHDLPKKLPRQPVVGMKVYARIREPKDGIYAGTIDAILNDGYRVTFEKEEMIPGMFVPDNEVMTENPLELLSISYFIEMNNANNRTGPVGGYGKTAFVIDPRKPQLVAMRSAPNQPVTYAFQNRIAPAVRDEKIGNFPLRMLVIMVKLFKVLEHKKLLIQNLTWMNDEGEKMQMLTRFYPEAFQERYAEILRELDTVNRSLESYMNGIEEYNDLLVANLATPQPADRPDQLRKSTAAHANQLVKHCNSELHVQSKGALSLISKLTSLMLQIRQLGVERKHHIHYELSILAETLNQIKIEISPRNIGHFQDCVEVHLKQVFIMMNKARTL
ncbi:Protein lin-9 [Aphelenchoides besseyi]|nr:Protein lin-9 [Aphelenchoides besseyi]